MIKTIEFGTDGIRGKAHEHPFTSASLFLLGAAIGSWCTKKYPLKTPTILLGHDTRESCARIKESLIKGLLTSAVAIEDAGTIPTPAVLQTMRQHPRFDCGIIISASHNFYEDNGIKLVDRILGKLTSDDEEAIVSHFYTLAKASLQEPHFSRTSSDQGTQKTFHAAHISYTEHMQSLFQPHFLKGIHVVLDCAHGATYQVAPAIFRALGAQLTVLNNEPTGTNINNNCGALHPELLQKTVVERKATIGFAFDGDGDRVVAVTHKGVVKDGDDLISLLLSHPLYQPLTTVVGTVMTNYGFQQYLAEQGKHLLRVKVGDRYVSQALFENNLTLGGETSGHIILYDYLPTGDGIFAALRVLEALMLNNNWDMETFQKYPQIIINVPVMNKKDLRVQPFSTIIAHHEQQLDNGRLVVRYSGTENVLRIMVEDSDQATAHLTAHALAHTLEQALR